MIAWDDTEVSYNHSCFSMHGESNSDIILYYSQEY